MIEFPSADEHDEAAKADYFRLQKRRTPGILTVRVHVADLAAIRRDAAARAVEKLQGGAS